jgi:hypothetical protein
MKPVQVDLPYLVEDEDRHGTVRLYVRRFGRKVRIRAVPGSPALLEAYRKALERACTERLTLINRLTSECEQMRQLSIQQSG